MSKSRFNSSPLASKIASKAQKAFEYSDILFAGAVIGIILVLLFPVPKFLLDFLLAISITSSVIILITSLLIGKPLELSTFPSILLIVTMLRLSLNIASTRLILSEGHTGPHAAGKMIEAFGHFVMGGNLVIGIIVFAILTIINFVVITKGSGRIAEVAARFSLDAMPGKQMAIDADLSAGLIDEITAKFRRKELEDESTFYGSMDGANKFVRGDAIAGLLITFINFIGGIIIGVVQRDLDFSEALHSYTILTIGDGLVSQVPSLIVSLAAGLLVSKSGVVGSTEKAIFGQISKFPHALMISAGLMFLMGFIPGIPAFPFLLLGLTIGGITYMLNNKEILELLDKATKKDEPLEANEPQTVKTEEESITESLQIENIRIELGYGLIGLVNNKGIKLPDQIKSLRKQIAKDLGFILPSVRIQDNMELEQNYYTIFVKEIKCGEGLIRPEMVLVMNPKGGKIEFNGENTKEPAFGLDAMWVPEIYREEAINREYTVIDPITVLTTHLTEIVKENITELLTYSETQKLLDDLTQEHKKLLNEISPNQISISGIQRILQNLLNELISIRDLQAILEAISECCRSTKNIMLITEYVRSRLARQISHANIDEHGFLTVVVLSAEWEQLFNESLVGTTDDRQLTVPPSKLQKFMQVIKSAYEDFAMKGEMPALLVSPSIRPYIRSIIERFRPITVVLSQNEIHPKIKVKTIGQI
ncbi:flagellar biosynthesis protein FlhA [Rickettsiales endosymbiont of Stachyamoeba lipophora]|uniref:flagellar biosynthesis protein FlhA n=1 Tax=Rickettsiales endosymbiont of Stachyamoeba lipophora TaxID=2486578 RepID=UPI000F65053F|nr:flagellar biosynthesis protein FlhA [Rickettsiales endosymbiont of Stachyamoeba lipophora]AZL15635.1 flagellar biosynthesis protein FlhA [Rickettsiales endosymbiont of Stachyamoeba lipophora]